MFRIIVFLLVASVLALGAAWIADRPGEISIVWLGWHIEASILVGTVGLLILLAIALVVWSMVRGLWRSPHTFARYLRRRRDLRGDRAISRGLIAVGAGDLRGARKFADEAAKLRAHEPLALLLNAQTAQLAGDRQAADSVFRAMAERNDMKLLGLRGLFVEARRREDFSAARALAEEAARAAPDVAWAGQAALEFRCVSGDWDGALAALDRNMQNGLIDKAVYRRQRAVLLTACALAIEETDRDRARELALEAVKNAPTLVPAAELAARLLIEKRKQRRAAKIIERAWAANPHPELAQVYAYLRPADSARERLARVRRLAEKIPAHVESAIAVARAAIDAQEFTAARLALKPLLAHPTQRVAELMSDLEQNESGHEGRAREWMARALRAPRDAAWTADGFVSDRWLPVSPVSGRIDAFEWKLPLAELGAAASPVAAQAGTAPAVDTDLPQKILPDQTMAAAGEAAPANDDERTPDRADVTPLRTVPARRRAAAVVEKPAEPVIPLVHAPDDPGPDPASEPDVKPEPAPAEAWWHIRLFK